MPNNAIMGQPVNPCINGITKAQATKINEIDGIKADIAAIEGQISGLNGGQWIELPYSDYEEFAEYLLKIVDFETGNAKYDVMIKCNYADNDIIDIIPKNTVLTGNIQYSSFETRSNTDITLFYYNFDIEDLLSLETSQWEMIQHTITIVNTDNSASYQRITVQIPRTSFKVFVFASDIENL